MYINVHFCSQLQTSEEVSITFHAPESVATQNATTLSPSEIQRQAAPTFTSHDQTAVEENGNQQMSFPTTEDTLLSGAHSPVFATTENAGDNEDGGHGSGRDDSSINIAPEDAEQQLSG